MSQVIRFPASSAPAGNVSRQRAEALAEVMGAPEALVGDILTAVRQVMSGAEEPPRRLEGSRPGSRGHAAR